jgi:hypothetical protein
MADLALAAAEEAAEEALFLIAFTVLGLALAKR